MSADAEEIVETGRVFDLSDIAGFSVAVIIVEVFDGIANLISSIFDAFLLRPAAGLTEFLTQFVLTLIGLPARQVDAAASQTAAAVSQNPILGFLIAIVMVLGLAYLFQFGVDLSG